MIEAGPRRRCREGCCAEMRTSNWNMGAEAPGTMKPFREGVKVARGKSVSR